MAGEIIRPSALPPRDNPVASEVVPSDNGSTVGGVTWAEGVAAGRPLANQAEAEAGVNATKAMTPLTTKQAIDALAVTSITAGANTTVDLTDPQNPVISYDGSAVTDGDKGDITVSSSGTAWSVNDGLSSSKIAYVAAATDSVSRTVSSKLFDWISVKDFGATGDGVTDDRAACQKAIDAAVAAGGGVVLFPTGEYLLNGVASPDSLDNGLLIPFSSFTVDNRVTLMASGLAVLKAGSDDMIVVRVCQPGSEVIGLQIDGGRIYNDLASGLEGVWGIGHIPEDMTQSDTLVSQSFCKVIDCHITRCEEGYVLAPGPNVGGFGSGAYYPVIQNCDFNLNARAMWFRAGFVADPTNRPTRINISACRVERGNTGIDFEQVTEATVVGVYSQFLRNTYGTSPYADGSGMRIGELTENVTVLSWESEACDYDFHVHASALPNALRVPLGSNMGGISSGTNFSAIQAEPFIRLTRRSSAYEQCHVTANHSGFARLVFDWGAANVRDANIETNGSRRMSWFNGQTTHYGSSGDINLLNTGATIQGTASTGLTVSTTGTNLALSAGGKSVLQNTNGLHPGADNTSALGLTAFRWTQLSAATATINTSDRALKEWRGGLDEAEMRVAVRLSKLVGIYRWKEAIEKKGDGARLHPGVIAQDVMAAFEAEGLNPFAYGMVCYDEWDDFTEPVTETREVVITDADGNPIIDESTGRPITEPREVETGEMRIVRPAGHLYGLRYDELWAFVAAGFEARLAALETA